MSTELATIDHTNGLARPEPDGGMTIGQAIEQYGHLAGQISRTEFVPESFRSKPEAILAAMLYGRELGLGPMQSLNLIQSIKGKVGLKPEGMRALVRQQGHRIWPEQMSDTAVTLCGWRHGDPADAVIRVTWTLEDAKRAGLGQGDNWRKYPRAMLTARATSELCRLHFADVIGGLSYTPEEIGDFDDAPEWAPAPPPAPDVETGEIVAPSRQATTRRRPPQRPQPEPADAQHVPVGHVSAAAGKARLLAAYEEIGVERENAKASAAAVWQTSGLPEGPAATVDAERVERLIADIVGSRAAQETGDAEAPF